MFITTFLGHQGWVFQTAQACILVDPLLEEEFGQAHALERRMYPPRVFKLEAFPQVDAVVLTHEHDDHFDLPSLARLERKIPIYLSARTSTAAFKILRAMGFTVHPMVPGVVFSFADLQVLPLCGDHVNTNSGDEWDALPFMVREVGGAGSFFSMVDCTLTSGHIALARTFAPRPGIIGWSNNAQDWSHMIASAPEQTQGTAQCVQSMREDLGVLGSMWGQPGAIVLCAGGFSFYGARKWLNRRVFSVDPERVVKTIGTQLTSQRFIAGRPGHTLYMEDNQVRRVEKQSPFLTTTPPNTWPLREKTAMTEFPDYAPATGRQELSEAELVRLREKLGEFAGALVGSSLFRHLYSLLEIEGGGRRCTFAFVLRQGEGTAPLVFVYEPSACAFDPTDSPPTAFIAGMECWATDLLAVLSGDMADIALLFGRAKLWNALPSRFHFDLFGELQRISCPLRRPAECLRLYERIWQSLGEVQPTIKHRSA